MENKDNLKIVHKSSDETVNDDKQKPLTHEELIIELGKLDTIQSREQLVIENLRRKGL